MRLFVVIAVLAFVFGFGASTQPARAGEVLCDPGYHSRVSNTDPSVQLCEPDCPEGQTSQAIYDQNGQHVDFGPCGPMDGGGSEVEPEMTQVCVGLGGDALELTFWTEEEVAAAEDKYGFAPLPDPVTGTCQQPNGLPLGADEADYAYVCRLNAAGELVGPGWIANRSLVGNEVAPNDLGQCVAPAKPEETPTDEPVSGLVDDDECDQPCGQVAENEVVQGADEVTGVQEASGPSAVKSLPNTGTGAAGTTGPSGTALLVLLSLGALLSGGVAVRRLRLR